MKRALILHGTDETPTSVPWQIRLKHQLEQSGYDVFFPQLPGCHTPNLRTYDRFLQESGWDFTDTILVGHSSGATTALHLLGADWFPHAKAAVLVGTFLNERLLGAASWYEPGQFNGLFTESIDSAKIKQGADRFYFVHGDDDPYCDYSEAMELSRKVAGTFITIPKGHHLGLATLELPQLATILKKDGLLK